jgi:plasmid stabilization system protein ParE
MKLIYSPQSLVDIEHIGHYYALHAGTFVAQIIGARIRGAVEQIRQFPESSSPLQQRPAVRAMPVPHSSYRIFYRATEGAVEILTIRHTSQKPLE